VDKHGTPATNQNVPIAGNSIFYAVNAEFLFRQLDSQSGVKGSNQTPPFTEEIGIRKSELSV
jgi:hypothetical protein